MYLFEVKPTNFCMLAFENRKFHSQRILPHGKIIVIYYSFTAQLLLRAQGAPIFTDGIDVTHVINLRNPCGGDSESETNSSIITSTDVQQHLPNIVEITRHVTSQLQGITDQFVSVIKHLFFLSFFLGVYGRV